MRDDHWGPFVAYSKPVSKHVYESKQFDNQQFKTIESTCKQRNKRRRKKQQLSNEHLNNIQQIIKTPIVI